MTSHVGAPPAAGLSMTELRQRLHGHLRSNGALGQLKTQLRTMILTEVMRATPVADIASGPAGKRSYTETLADTLVAQHLSATGKPFSASVFASEANLAPSPEDEHELRKILRTGDADGSVLVAMIRDAKDRTVAAAAPSVSVGVQADGDLLERTMEQRLDDIDSEFIRKQRESTTATRGDIELYLSNYRAALEADMRRELEQMNRTFRERELASMRQQEAAKYNGILKLKHEEFAELERSLQHRVAFERSRMDQLRKDLELRAADMDRRSHEAFSQLDDRDKRIGELEGKLRDARSRMQQMRDDVLRYEELAAQRLKDLEMARNREQRRIDDIRRMQAEHNDELRVRSDEVAALMQRFRDGVPRAPVLQSDHGMADERPGRLDPTRTGATMSAGVVSERAASDSRKLPAAEPASLPSRTGPVSATQAVPVAREMTAAARTASSYAAVDDEIHDSSGAPSAHEIERVHHLSQVSTITGHTNTTRKAQEDLTHHAESTSSSASSVSRSEEGSALETSVAAAREAATAAAATELAADQARARLSVQDEQDAEFRAVADEIRGFLRKLQLQSAVAPLMDLERAGREALTTDEDSAFKQIMWSAKRNKDDALAREDAATAAKYGGGMSSRPAVAAPVFVVSDDEDGSDLLFKKSSDDESF